MNEKHLHIVCLDVPYPVNYGGAFAVFYKIKALAAQGVKIHLHCFIHQRPQQSILKEYCEEVYYYERRKIVKSLPIRLPYIVSTRVSEILFQRLLQDDHPIMLESIHTTALLKDKRFVSRKIFVSVYNIEHIYYDRLARSSSSLIKKMYYLQESRLLRKFESSITDKAVFLCLSEQDAVYYKEIFEAPEVFHSPPFLPWNNCESKVGKGSFCLYHGNLSVTENEAAAVWLLSDVFDDLRLPFVIAGLKPSVRLKRIISAHPHCQLVENPSDQELGHLIQSAQINILPSFNQTGIKFKILHALFLGRYCLVNPASLTESQFSSLCEYAHDAPEMKKQIALLFERAFSSNEIEKRNEVLQQAYNNEKNARNLIQLIW